MGAGENWRIRVRRERLVGGAALAVAVLVAARGVAVAEIVNVSDQGFAFSDTAPVSAPAAKVFAAIVDIGRWWNSEHTYSGDATNLRIDLKPGGCFCETLPAGGAHLHMTVADIQPGKSLRLVGALGPLQAEGVAGSLTWSIKPTENGVALTQSYIVGGYLREGAAKWAPRVDGVLHEQFIRLKSYIETGSPAPATPKP